MKKLEMESRMLKEKAQELQNTALFLNDKNLHDKKGEDLESVYLNYMQGIQSSVIIFFI